jgi:hypothetical protein
MVAFGAPMTRTLPPIAIGKPNWSPSPHRWRQASSQQGSAEELHSTKHPAALAMKMQTTARLYSSHPALARVYFCFQFLMKARLRFLVSNQTLRSCFQ